MKQKQHSTEEIIRILRQADGDETVESICRAHNISRATFHRWRRKYGDMDLADAKRLKELEKGNAELKLGPLPGSHRHGNRAAQGPARSSQPQCVISPDAASFPAAALGPTRDRPGRCRISLQGDAEADSGAEILLCDESGAHLEVRRWPFA